MQLSSVRPGAYGSHAPRACKGPLAQSLTPLTTDTFVFPNLSAQPRFLFRRFFTVSVICPLDSGRRDRHRKPLGHLDSSQYCDDMRQEVRWRSQSRCLGV